MEIEKCTIADAFAMTPEKISRTTGIGSAKTYDLGQIGNVRVMPTELVITMTAKEDNDTTFIIGDAFGFIRENYGITVSVPEMANPSKKYANVEMSMLKRTYVTKQIRIEATDTIQFKNKILVASSDLDESTSIRPKVLNTSVNADQFNSKIQFYDAQTRIGGNDALIYNVSKGLTVQMTIYFDGIINFD